MPAPSGPSSHLCPSAARKSIGVVPHVERQHAQALDGIDEEEHAALAAQGADGVEVVAEAAGIFDEAEADQARAAVDGRAQIVDSRAAVAAGHQAQLDAAAGQVHPRIEVGGVFLRGGDDVVAGLPGEALRRRCRCLRWCS